MTFSTFRLNKIIINQLNLQQNNILSKQEKNWLKKDPYTQNLKKILVELNTKAKHILFDGFQHQVGVLPDGSLCDGFQHQVGNSEPRGNTKNEEYLSEGLWSRPVQNPDGLYGDVTEKRTSRKVSQKLSGCCFEGLL